MAEFRIHSLEGTQYVDAHLTDETIRAEAGALCYMTGHIEMRSKLIPSLRGILRAVLADEAVYRPRFTGTGVISLESTMGGFHVLDLAGETWILEPGSYWASEDRIEISHRRERMATAFWLGEGLVYLQTRVSGTGKVVVTTRGPVEVLDLAAGNRLVVEGNAVICRTEGVSFRVGMATRNFWGWLTSGEGRVRIYEGPGKVLLNPAPYWRYRLMVGRGEAAAGVPDPAA